MKISFSNYTEMVAQREKGKGGGTQDGECSACSSTAQYPALIAARNKKPERRKEGGEKCEDWASGAR